MTFPQWRPASWKAIQSALPKLPKRPDPATRDADVTDVDFKTAEYAGERCFRCGWHMLNPVTAGNRGWVDAFLPDGESAGWMCHARIAFRRYRHRTGV